MNVAVVATGARTPLGYHAVSSAAGFRCGLQRIRSHPFMVDKLGNPVRAGIDDALDPERLGAVRLLTLARSALEEALAGLKVDLADGTQIDVLLALPETRPGFTDANAAWVARELTHGMLPRPPELAACGHAGALDAIRDAAVRIAEGRADLCAVVGVDSYLDADTIEWLEATERLSGEDAREGFLPGEGAGCIVLASPVARGSLRLPSLAWVRGAHSSRESSLVHGEEEVFGRGMSEAILGATADLRLPDERIDEVYCDINGERYRTDEWGFAVLRTGHTLRTVQYQMPSACWGDTGAAAGALGCVLAIKAWAARPTARWTRTAPGPRALVCGGSDLGLRSAVVLQDDGGA